MGVDLKIPESRPHLWPMPILNFTPSSHFASLPITLRLLPPRRQVSALVQHKLQICYRNCRNNRGQETSLGHLGGGWKYSPCCPPQVLIPEVGACSACTFIKLPRISPGDVMYSIVTLVNNTILYTEIPCFSSLRYAASFTKDLH